MALVRQHSTLITVEDADVSIDAEAAAGLPSQKGSIELAVIGFANFMSGSYQQLSSDVQDITSTVSINSAQVKKASFALLTEAPSDAGITFTSYGKAVKNTGDKLVIQSKSALNKDNNNTAISVVNPAQDWFANLRVWAGTDTNIIHNGSNVKNGQGIGAVLVQAAGAALFKSLGKNAAINNENSVESKQSKLSSDIANAIQESAKDYTDSAMFKRYLDSGRYYDDNADVGSSHAYNFNNANLDFVVQLQGSLSDSSTNAALSATAITRILGNSDNTKVLSNSTYKMNIFVRLQQRDDL